MPPPRVLLAAGGAGWESRLLPLLTTPGSPAALARRCVDVPDLVAAAAAGQGTVAAVASDLAGLDADAVARLVDAGVAVLAVAATASSAHRLHQLGVNTVLDAAYRSKHGHYASIVDAVAEGRAAAAGVPAAHAAEAPVEQ